MDKERSTDISVGGQTYTLILTTRATKEIAGRYGGLENLGDKLMKQENFEMAIEEIVWIITLLANQSIQIHNFQNPDSPRPLLTEEMVELLTSPFELAEYKDAIMEALYRGVVFIELRVDEFHFGAEDLEGGIDVGQGLLEFLFTLKPQLQAKFVRHGPSPPIARPG